METVLKNTLMDRIYALSFAIYETLLYLDGHPTDSAAMTYLMENKAELKRATEEYEMKFGPLSLDSEHGMQNSSEWLWVTRPWPWQQGEDRTVRGK